MQRYNSQNCHKDNYYCTSVYYDKSEKYGDHVIGSQQIRDCPDDVQDGLEKSKPVSFVIFVITTSNIGLFLKFYRRVNLQSNSHSSRLIRNALLHYLVKCNQRWRK